MLSFVLSACGTQATPAPTPSPMTQPFTTEIIVRTAENFHRPQDVATFVELAQQTHVSVISLLVKQDEDAFVKSGQVYYRSKIAPSAPGYLHFDVLQTMLDEAHARGIKVYAWIPQFHDQAAARKHPDWQMMAFVDGQVVPYSGSGQTEYFVNPLHPDVQAYELSIIQEIAENYPVDGIMLDWIRFDDYNMDVSDITRGQYQSLSGVDPLTLDFQNPSPAIEQWNDFRTDAIAAYAQKVRESLPANLHLGVYILPPEFVEVGQDAAKFNADVDALAPMCYFRDWGYPLEWFWESCLAGAAQKSGKTELVPVMDSHLNDEAYRQIFAHLRRDFPQVTSLAWFFYGQWTEEMFVHINAMWTQIPPTPTAAPNPTTTAVPSLSQGKPAFASSIENEGLGPQYAVDGDPATRWGSLEGQDPQWFYVDLGEPKDITRVKIAWEDSYATRYEIQVSDNAQNWITAYSAENGQGGIEEIPISATARYVRMYGIERGTEWGYSIYEFDVYDASYPLPPIVSPTPRAMDLRSYQHGIDFLPLPDGKYALIWSSSGNPPTGADKNGSWTHDIYYSLIDPANPVITPTMIISAPEAQEPSSAAISPDGHIFITNEDGYNTQNVIAQRYGVYDTNLAPILPYPQMVEDGAHSGHVAAVGNRFVIFYSNGWVDDGGVDNLGSGDNVLAKIYASDGKYQQAVEVCVSQATRDWWPVVAGSSTHAALVWQRFVNDQTYADLVFSLLDPATGALLKDQVVLEQQVKYYTYNVTYIPAVDRFLALGTYEAGGGFAYLLDNDGNVVASNKTLPAIVRESHSIVLNQSGSALVAQVTAPTGLMALAVTPTDVLLKTTIAGDYEWRYTGIDGIFVNASQIYLVSLSENGLVDMTFSIP